MLQEEHTRFSEFRMAVDPFFNWGLTVQQMLAPCAHKTVVDLIKCYKAASYPLSSFGHTFLGPWLRSSVVSVLCRVKSMVALRCLQNSRLFFWAESQVKGLLQTWDSLVLVFHCHLDRELATYHLSIVFTYLSALILIILNSIIHSPLCSLAILFAASMSLHIRHTSHTRDILIWLYLGHYWCSLPAHHKEMMSSSPLCSHNVW